MKSIPQIYLDNMKKITQFWRVPRKTEEYIAAWRVSRKKEKYIATWRVSRKKKRTLQFWRVPQKIEDDSVILKSIPKKKSILQLQTVSRNSEKYPAFTESILKAIESPKKYTKTL
ncbi:Uncharacterised protein [Bacillus freudenreichii]|nr:Uncharacterised protein [Bacillus freudenreichii]